MNPDDFQPVAFPIDGNDHGYEGDIVVLHENGIYQLNHSNWVGNGECSSPGDNEKSQAYESLRELGFTHWIPLDWAFGAIPKKYMDIVKDFNLTCKDLGWTFIISEDDTIVLTTKFTPDSDKLMKHANDEVDYFLNIIPRGVNEYRGLTDDSFSILRYKQHGKLVLNIYSGHPFVIKALRQLKQGK